MLSATSPSTDPVPVPGDELERARRSERVRMADALHDDALQRLAALRQDLAELHGDLSPMRLREAERALEEAVEALRSVTRAAHDEALAAMALPLAVGYVVGDVAIRSGLRPVLRVTDQPLHAADVAFVVSVVRELSANVAAHADARHLAVVVAVEDGTLRVAVSDDGVGVTAEQIAARGAEGHLGLAVLRSRALARAGSFAVASAGATGTTVTLAMPLRPTGSDA